LHNWHSGPPGEYTRHYCHISRQEDATISDQYIHNESGGGRLSHNVDWDTGDCAVHDEPGLAPRGDLMQGQPIHSGRVPLRVHPVPGVSLHRKVGLRLTHYVTMLDLHLVTLLTLSPPNKLSSA